MKRIGTMLFLFLVCGMLSVISLSGCGEYVDPSLVFEWDGNSGTYTVTDYDVAEGVKVAEKIVIPSAYKGYPVTKIGKNAFAGCSRLKELVIPDSVTEIESGAFSGCTGLTSATVGNGIAYISTNVFSNLKELTSIAIGAGVTGIGDEAFKGCTKLTNIIIPENVTSIGNSAFYGCTSLTSIIVPKSVTTIGGSCFQNCTSLLSITLPFVGDSAKNGEYAHFGYIFGSYSLYDGNKYVPVSLQTVIITGGSKISKSAFYGCSHLRSITIPSSVSRIDAYAFVGCNNLQSVIFEEPTGWAVFRNTDFSISNGDKIDENDLSDEKTAANYLTDLYKAEYWRRRFVH